MSLPNFLHIAREGWLVLIALGAGAWWLYVQFGPLPAAPVAIVALVLVAVFHDAEHRLSSSPLGVVAPVDGRVVSVATGHDPFLDREALCIELAVSVFGSYCFRAPIEGQIKELRSEVDCSEASWIRSDEEDDVVTHVTAGSLLGRRPCVVGFGQRVGQGKRCGLRRLATRVTVYAPANTRAVAAPGDRVKAGTDVLASLVRVKAAKEEAATDTATQPRPVEAAAA